MRFLVVLFGVVKVARHGFSAVDSSRPARGFALCSVSVSLARGRDGYRPPTLEGGRVGIAFYVTHIYDTLSTYFEYFCGDGVNKHLPFRLAGAK